MAKKGTDWVAIAFAIAALVISAVAAIFTGLQWHEARQQRQQQFDSALVFDVDTELPQRRAGIAVRNVGPGIARISSVTYYMDGKVQEDPGDALEQERLEPRRDEGVDLDRGDSMAAGEIDWLVRYPIGRREEEERARDLFEEHLAIAVEYCSAGGNCTRLCSLPDRCPIEKRMH
jgi:hypothetical protein